ncbi:MAG: MFS transporter [Ruminococcaceae bacterium]|nr:MFS transporter [Oscillospiraceae bacterium]
MSNKPLRRFGFRDKLGYLFGDFGNDFTFILSTMILMKFYTDHMGVSAGVVGAIMMVARIVDAFTDVAMGRICDRSRITAAGKFKPWIMRMCVPVAIASFLMYMAPISHLSTGIKTAYLLVTYLLWGSFCYTGINIPYGSMASAISEDPGDRQSLSTFRTMGGMLAGAIIGAGLPMVAYTKNADGNSVLVGNRVMLAAAIFSVLAIVCYILCYKLITERVTLTRNEVGTDEKPKTQSLGQMLKNAIKNRSLISIIVASIVMLLAQLTMQGMANYVYPNYYNSPAAQSASTVVMMVGMIVAAIIAKPLGKRFGKAEVSVVSNVFAALVNLVLFFVRPESVWVYVGMQTLAWLGLGIFSMVSWALITDVIDDAEIRNGVREDGSVYAMYSWARKLGQAASAGLTGWLLELVGYTSETAFDPDVTLGIYNISVLVPVLGFGLLAAVLWFWYPLHKKKVDANVAALKEKHSK